ncbi:MAG: hypothetical protein ABT01_02560 [Clostridium sp. SCN 57-10]|nr:MAG: hypothetical protein ABT01_02560 [Clostridium sp. SCN 57-10]
MEQQVHFKSVFKYAGAFIAWVIGSGFATGQEILQFFTSYGWFSYAVVFINLVGFLFLGKTMMTKGFEHQDEAGFDHYRFYCGKKLGAVYSWVIPTTLFLTTAVLLSASGSTLKEYFGLNRYLGSALMAMLVLAAYLIGFEKMVKIVSKVGPVIVVLSIFVGAYTVVRDASNFSEIGASAQLLAASQTSPHWSISAVLYLSLNFLCGSTYYTALGRSAASRSDAKWGAVIGAVVLIISIALVNTAILLNAADSSAFNVPTLYLGNRISRAFGTVFSITLILGIFSSCSTMMWSFCNRFFTNDKKKNRIFAAIVAILTFALGLFPFGGLVAVVYPLIGYAGLIFIGCVVYKGLKKDSKQEATIGEMEAAI